MCGIAGYLNLDGSPASAAVLEAMCDAIVHRGPDSAGLMVEGPVALGMRRLAIVDLSTGDQPMHSPDGNASIVFNGESYSFAAERVHLEAAGRRFNTHSDTEVVLGLYERHGLDCTRGLRGMFGIAIWDRRLQRLLLVRDRIGKKPLHYLDDGKSFFFASEIKSILVALERLGRPAPELDEHALVRYMGLGYVPDPETIFRGIRKLPPAHRLSLEKGRATIERYWQLDWSEDHSLDEEEHLARLEATLEEAVRMRMIADVPLGAYLSGGVDSSTVVGLMARLSDRPVKTFSIGFEEQGYDELVHARKVAEHLGTEHHEEVVRADAGAIIEDLVRHFDEPFADSSAIPTWYVSRMARQQVTVALSGDGGDEFFCGYSRYAKTASSGLATLPLGLRRVLFGGLARLLPAGFFGRSSLWNLALDDDERYLHHLSCGLSEWHGALFSRDFALRAGGSDPSDCYLEALGRRRGAPAEIRKMAADVDLYLPADIMTKVDRMSMAVSLEARAPLLDHVFAEQAARVPLAMKWRDGEGKLILKRLARKLVPAEVIDRKKQGFAVPVSAWFNEAWQERADDLLVGRRARERGIFQAATIERLLGEHRRGRRDHGHLLWSLMILELWFRLYRD